MSGPTVKAQRQARDLRSRVARAGLVGKGALYTLLGLLAINIAPGGGAAGGDQKQQAAAVVMGLPGGPWIVMIAGLAAIGFGGYQIYQDAINTEFMKRIGARDESATKTVETLGRVGYAGSGGVTIGVGLFLFLAGLNYDPANVKGLSGILTELAAKSWG